MSYESAPLREADHNPDADVMIALSGLREAIGRLNHQVGRTEKAFAQVLRPADPNPGSALSVASPSAPSPLGHELGMMRDEVSNLADLLANVCNRSAL